MPTDREIEEKFWKALKSDRTMMLGLDGVEDGRTRPMTGQFEDDKGPIWFFTSDENAIVGALGNRAGGGERAIATFVSKGHDPFVTVQGTLSLDTDRAVIERLWNPFVAAWFEDGKDDPGSDCSGSTPTKPKSGLTDRASSPGSRRCSASIQDRITRTKWRRSSWANASMAPGALVPLNWRVTYR